MSDKKERASLSGGLIGGLSGGTIGGNVAKILEEKPFLKGKNIKSVLANTGLKLVGTVGGSALGLKIPPMPVKAHPGNITPSNIYKEKQASVDLNKIKQSLKVLAPMAIAPTALATMFTLRKKQMEKKAIAPLLIPLIGAGLGALGGAATAPQGQRMSGALMGGAFGAFTGGFGATAGVGRALAKGGLSAARPLAQKGFGGMGMKAVGKNALRDTAGTALLTKVTGGYDQPRSPMMRPPQMDQFAPAGYNSPGNGGY